MHTRIATELLLLLLHLEADADKQETRGSSAGAPGKFDELAECGCPSGEAPSKGLRC